MRQGNKTMRKMAVLKAFFPLIVLGGGIANAQTPNSVPLSPTQIQAATNAAIAPAVPGGLTAATLNGIFNQFDPFTNLWFDASNAQNGLLNKWNGTAWVPLIITAANGGSGVTTATANTFLAGPATGSPAAGAYRAIVPADITTALTTSLTSPPPIGATAPNSIAATTLSASGATTLTGAISGAGVTALLAAPSPIGSTTPSTGAFTSLSSTLASPIAGIPFNPSVPVSSTFSGPNEPGILLTGGIPLNIASTFTTAGSQTPAGVAYFSSTETYVGAPGAGTFPAVYGFNKIGGGAQGPQAGLLGVAFNGNTVGSQPSGPSGAIGTYGQGICGVSGCTATWGGVMAAYGFGAANPTNPSIGLEVDNYDIGTDNNGVRVDLQLVCAKGSFVGTAPTCTNIILASGNAGNVFNYTGTATNGINFNGASLTNVIISPAFTVSGLGDITGRNIVANTLNLSGAVFWGTDTGTSGGQILLDSGSGNFFFDDLTGGSWVFRTTAAAEVARITNTGILNITAAGGFAANGSVATVLGSLGPPGSHTTVQQWLVVQKSGTTGWIPMF
jgi:hypothetical protein